MLSLLHTREIRSNGRSAVSAPEHPGKSLQFWKSMTAFYAFDYQPQDTPLALLFQAIILGEWLEPVSPDLLNMSLDDYVISR